MGNNTSKMDRHYGNYEKSFERIEKDVLRLKGELATRRRSRSRLSMWTSMLVAAAVVIAAAIIYQIQQQPAGTYTYQEHFNRTAAAMAVPAFAVLLHYVSVVALDLKQRRDLRKLQRLEEAKRAMLKELKEMTRFDRIKTLIDRFDPDARPPPPAQPGMMLKIINNGLQGGAGGGGPPGQMPALLVKGSGQVAGAAALAVAGAGKALMPLVDRLATTLISDNPVLVEDLRQLQQQLQDAQVRTVGAVQESYAMKQENLDLKTRLVDLEKQLDLPPSFDAEALQELQEQLHQQAQQAQQAAWQVQLQQQYLQGGPGQYQQSDTGSGSFEGQVPQQQYNNASGSFAGQAGSGDGEQQQQQLAAGSRSGSAGHLTKVESRSGSAARLAKVDTTPTGTPKTVY